jgi:hypothetical protein
MIKDNALMRDPEHSSERALGADSTLRIVRQKALVFEWVVRDSRVVRKKAIVS